jgi:hypothetical protein
VPRFPVPVVCVMEVDTAPMAIDSESRFAAVAMRDKRRIHLKQALQMAADPFI